MQNIIVSKLWKALYTTANLLEFLKQKILYSALNLINQFETYREDRLVELKIRNSLSSAQAYFYNLFFKLQKYN